MQKASGGYIPALIIPPKGRAVLCAWAAVPGLILAPFVFWRSVWAGLALCLLWAVLIEGVRVRACSFVAAAGERMLTVYAGVAFPTRRAVPLCAVNGVECLRTPLQRLAGVSLLAISSPGMRVILPAVPAQDAQRLAAALTEGRG